MTYRLTFTSGLVLHLQSPTVGSLLSLQEACCARPAVYGSIEDMTPIPKALPRVKLLRQNPCLTTRI